jgi:hypothetical protein
MQGAHRLRSLSALLVLAFLLCVPWSGEAGSAEAPRAESAASHSIGHLIGWLGTLWGDVGCTWDPDGACRDAAGSGPVTASDRFDNGCTWDPNGGGCGRAANMDNGCTMDPDGRGYRGNR